MFVLYHFLATNKFMELSRSFSWNWMLIRNRGIRKKKNIVRQFGFRQERIVRLCYLLRQRHESS